MVNKTWSRWNPWMIGLTGGAIALGLVGFGVLQLTQARRDQNSAAETAPLPQRTSVVALGRLEPDGEVIRLGGPSGERIGQLLASEGTWVETGTALAYLESYQERLAERNYAASQLTEAERRLQAETTFGQAQIQEASTRIGQVDEPRGFEIEAQGARVRELEAELGLANQDLNRALSLQQEGAIAQQELDRQVTAVQQIQEQISNAQATLVRLETGRSMDMQNARAQLQMTQAELPLSQIQVAVDSARRNLELAEARLERTIIRAPRPGRVLRVLAKAGEAIGSSGVVDLGDTSQMYVVAEVYETDVNLLVVGQPARITSRNGAFERELTGQVADIGWQIFKNDVLDDDPAANADARVVEVKVRLDQSEPVAALTNLQVDVTIAVD